MRLTNVAVVWLPWFPYSLPFIHFQKENNNQPVIADIMRSPGHCIMQMHILSFSGKYALAELSDNHRTHLSQGIRGPSLHHSADVCRHKIYRMAPIHKVHHLCCEPATNPAKANLNHVKPCNSHFTLSMLNRFDAFQMRRCPAPTLSQIFRINLMKVLPTYMLSAYVQASNVRITACPAAVYEAFAAFADALFHRSSAQS